MSKTFKGKSEDAGSPILGAEFWKSGVSIAGVVFRSFQTAHGECYELKLVNPVMLDGVETREVSIGALAGFKMALAAAGLERLFKGDALHITATGETETTKGNPRVNFEIEVIRG